MRKRKNRIEQLKKADGSLTEDVGEMQAMTTDFYKSLFQTEGTSNMDAVLNTVPCKVTRDMNEKLLAPFSEAEVKSALFQMFPTNAHFYQKHWELCGSEDVLERRNNNVEAHNFARSSVALQPGRHVWLGSSPDPFFVPKCTAV